MDDNVLDDMLKRIDELEKYTRHCARQNQLLVDQLMKHANMLQAHEMGLQTLLRRQNQQ